MAKRYPIGGTNLWRDEDGCVAPPPGVVERMRADEAYRRTLDEDSCMSFAEWGDAGFFVQRGMRSMFRDVEGIPQFTKEQVSGRFLPEREDGEIYDNE